jgi:hypothetical protein
MRDWAVCTSLRPRSLRSADSHWLTPLETSVTSSPSNKEPSLRISICAVLENSLQDRLRAAPWILASYKSSSRRTRRKDMGGVGKHFSVPQVLNVTLSMAPVPVNQDNLSRHSRVQQGVRGGRPNKACPNDRNLWDPRSCTLRLFLGAIFTSSQCRNVRFTLLFRLMSCA